MGNLYSKMILDLEQISIPFYLSKRLEERLVPSSTNRKERIQERISSHSDIIDHLETILKQKNLGTPRDSNTKFQTVAEEVTPYFQQGCELFKSVLTTGENSNPLIEYYALLQCVKGAILLEIDLDKKHFFGHHGLTKDNILDTTPYITTNIHKYGVFPALLLFYAKKNNNSFYQMNTYFKTDYKPSLLEILTDCDDGPKIFIGSWMLSTLVRYKPDSWLEILSGKNDDIIGKIRYFRRDRIQWLVGNLLRQYFPMRYSEI